MLFDAGERNFAGAEARAALLEHILSPVGVFTIKDAVERCGASMDSLKTWKRQLHTLLGVEQLSSFGQDALEAAINQLRIGEVGRPSYLYPLECAILIAHLCALSSRGRCVSRGVVAAFGLKLLHSMAELEPDAAKADQLSRAKTGRSWVDTTLKTARSAAGALQKKWCGALCRKNLTGIPSNPQGLIRIGRSNTRSLSRAPGPSTPRMRCVMKNRNVASFPT